MAHGQRNDALLVVLGGIVAITGLIFISACGPTPGGTCSVGAENVFVTYLLGAVGAALIAVGLTRSEIVDKDSSISSASTSTTLVALASALIGGIVMLLGSLFTCLDSLLIPGVAICGVGAGSALIAYLFGMVGSGLLSGGLWKLWSGRSRRFSPRSRLTSAKQGSS